jgi:hypothetical protein
MISFVVLPDTPRRQLRGQPRSNRFRFNLDEAGAIALVGARLAREVSAAVLTDTAHDQLRGFA